MIRPVRLGDKREVSSKRLLLERFCEAPISSQQAPHGASQMRPYNCENLRWRQ